MKKKFSKVKAVKALARERVGTIPPVRVVPHKHRAKPKHPKQEMEKEVSG